MNIAEIRLHHMKMKLKQPFKNSLTAVQEKEFFIIEAINDNGLSGYGETVAFDAPWYTEETVKTNRYVLEQFLIPLVKQAKLQHPRDLGEVFQPVRRHQMAKAALEEAVWDLFAKEQSMPLSQMLGGTRQQIPAGISLGIEADIQKLLDRISEKINAGYKRVKIKIKPGWDLDVLQQIRAVFPDVPLMADANSAYTIHDMDHLQKMDAFNLLMIEQPFAHNDFVDHARLQAVMETPVCLDESIHSYEDARTAIALGSCKVINVKIGRVGGLQEAMKIHDLCREHELDAWCGGMLESGIGRAHNIALASLPGFTLPGDIGESKHYWEEDLIVPEVEVSNGMIQIPETPGIGYNLNLDHMEKHRLREDIFRL